ncbi:DNA cytosine methyltransferase [Treponema sp. Marseille-Q4130]|uniref:DNA cytosine methyltransferase n=1 Tax=Treponema sp. Marseille-Q4130 TaxID=2766702 RepID=UPI001651CA9D|nr:DNA (cytosine-5-)-methyltransferase [Treponema sp. Marseille-Q4130]MBC6721319.1 DNA (cytosine-5-)-methyltransferase [Treponema sp. Marseille-Q4130]
MTYLSVCSGIEAASIAWEPLGWKAAGFAEIEPFPCELLKQKYPHVKNYGDMTKHENWDIGQFDILVGGTPCQSFSVAGKRGGTNDIRGQLMYSYLGIVAKYKPRWVLWENVPGVLSSGNGFDFASFVAGLEQCGYGWAYRVLDAQYFGVPQRRRRVFVVGHIGNRCDLASKVLFEQGGLRGDFATGKEEGKEIAGTLTSGFGARGLDMDGIASGQYAIDVYVVNGRQKPVTSKNITGALDTNGRTNIVFSTSSFGGYQDGVGTLRSSGGDNGYGSENLTVQKNRVRRLTPVECERLQGFPDNWTQIEWRGKPKEQCPDAPRYKAIGNSMAVPVMRWLGVRIERYTK